MKLSQLLFLFTLLLSSLVHAQKETHALLIAAHGYTAESKWSELGVSTLTDMQLIKDALTNKGVPEKNIIILDSNTTKETIANTILNCLIPALKPGDVVMLHYSGHGYQIPDNNKDELDGLDEALVPINAKFDGGRRKDEKFYENYLRDDELNKLLEQIRIKLGKTGDLFVSIDACHSGTSTRGLGPSRGAVRLDMESYQNAGVEENWEPVGEQSNLSNMVAFFASSQSQLNAEYQDDELSCGSLSFALSKALASSDQNTSYQALFEKVRSIMIGIVPAQTPNSEGNLNTTILGGNALPSAAFFRVKSILENNIVVISGGLLASVNEGSRIGFFPPDTREFKKSEALLTGKVMNATTTECEVLLDQPLSSRVENIELLWAFVLERNFGNVTVSVQLKNFNKELSKKIEQKIKENPFISIGKGSKADLFIEWNSNKTTQKNEISLNALREINFATSNFEVDENSFSDIHADWIIDQISNFAQGKFLRTLSVENPEYKANIALVEVEKIQGKTGRSPSDYLEIKKVNSKKFHINTLFRIDVENQSNHVVYYSILDIDASGKVNVVCPAKGRQPEEYKIFGESVISNNGIVIRVSPPLGQGVMKLIVSKQPINLQGLATSRGASANPNSNFDLFFQSTIKEKTRGVETVPIELDEIGIYDFVYEIIK